MKEMSENNAGKLSLEELEALIKKYFECETTEEEEARLLMELQACSYRSALIDECLVSMGYFSVGKAAEQKSKKRGKMVAIQRVVAIAAMTVLALTLGFLLLDKQDVNESDYCIAYVNGELVSDKNMVIELVEKDLSCIGQAVSEDRNSILEQLSGIQGVLSE